MADDENVVKPKTFEELFKIYSNYKINPLDVDNEIYDGILLTQIDLWLEKSKLLRAVFTLTDTGMAWMKFKKWRLDYDEFEELINSICAAKDVNPDQIKNQMTEAGPPTVETEQNIAVK